MAILSRFSGLFVIAPFFSGNLFPLRVKIPLTVTLSFIVLYFVPDYIPVDLPVGDMAVMILINFLYGFSAGLIANLMFFGLLFAGDIFGYQLGFAAANIFDPQSQTESVIVSQLVYLTGTYIFTIIKGPVVLLGILIESFVRVPAGIMTFDKELTWSLSLVLGEVLVFGMKVGMPMIVFMLLVTVVLGIMAKLLPQLNVFVVGIPLKIFVGLIILIGLLPILAETMVRYTQELGDWISNT
ncbi:MAG TPA: flagellar biosynthetic protein FliR, partial [Thermotogota bacterium]|nr:flagellar biosynthetic protein FliR [Thermotogota bacterium]